MLLNIVLELAIASDRARCDDRVLLRDRAWDEVAWKVHVSTSTSKYREGQIQSRPENAPSLNCLSASL